MEIKFEQDKNGALSTVCPFNVSYIGFPVRVGTYYCKNECPYSDGYQHSTKTVFCKNQGRIQENGTIQTKQ